MKIRFLGAARDRRIPDIPVFLNSPMAAGAGRVFQHHRAEHRMSPQESDAINELPTIVNTVDDSKALNERRGPMVIVSASGMATGGRVLHHLVAFAPDPRNVIMLTGFQAAGTRGAQLAGGATEIKIHGAYVPVRAEVVNIDSFSAHADYTEIMAWLRRLPRAPVNVFATHGEPQACDAMRVRIETQLDWRCTVPGHGSSWELDG
jgi:metallo-beta-lactamase family protein